MSKVDTWSSFVSQALGPHDSTIKHILGIQNYWVRE